MFLKDFKDQQIGALDARIQMKEQRITDLSDHVGRLQNQLRELQALKDEAEAAMKLSNPIIEYQDLDNETTRARYFNNPKEMEFLLRKLSRIAGGWFEKVNLGSFPLERYKTERDDASDARRYVIDMTGSKMYQLRDSISTIQVRITPTSPIAGLISEKVIRVIPAFKAIPQNDLNERKELVGITIEELVQPVKVVSQRNAQ